MVEVELEELLEDLPSPNTDCILEKIQLWEIRIGKYVREKTDNLRQYSPKKLTGYIVDMVYEFQN